MVPVGWEMGEGPLCLLSFNNGTGEGDMQRVLHRHLLGDECVGSQFEMMYCDVIEVFDLFACAEYGVIR